jgi:hypothetical protein
MLWRMVDQALGTGSHKARQRQAAVRAKDECNYPSEWTACRCATPAQAIAWMQDQLGRARGAGAGGARLDAYMH